MTRQIRSSQKKCHLVRKRVTGHADTFVEKVADQPCKAYDTASSCPKCTHVPEPSVPLQVFRMDRSCGCRYLAIPHGFVEKVSVAAAEGCPLRRKSCTWASDTGFFRPSQKKCQLEDRYRARRGRSAETNMSISDKIIVGNVLFAWNSEKNTGKFKKIFRDSIYQYQTNSSQKKFQFKSLQKPLREVCQGI